MQAETTRIGPKETAKFILSIVSNFRCGAFIMLVVCVYWVADMCIRPYLLKALLDRASEGIGIHDWTYLATPAIFWIFLSFGLTTIFRFYDYFVNIKMIPRMRTYICSILVSSLLVQSHSFYQNNFAGHLANKAQNVIGSLPELLQVISDRILSSCLLFIVSICILWHVSSNFGIVMLIWACLFLTGAIFSAGKITALSKEFSDRGSNVIGRLVDSLSNIMLIKLFARTRFETKYIDNAAQEAQNAESKLFWAYFWIWVFNGYSFTCVMALNFYYLLKGFNDGLLSVGDFALVSSISVNIVDNLWELTRNIAEFSKYFGRIMQGLNDIMQTPEIQDAKGAKKLIIKPQGGSIKFDKVVFQYKNTKALFEDKSIVIPAHQKVGLVGYSGSGKSTFVNLILRLYDINSGAITIDDQDISMVTQDSLHENISMIPQDPTLLHRTIMENIRYGKIEASDEEVISAAKKAHAHDFITALHMGYNALVGERGVKLSGGQRQRIAIARAILKNAPILMLDEATSQLDSITEAEIQNAIENLMADKTTIVIAHRLSTLLSMDRIIVFDSGKVVQDGTHKELLATEGLYKTLWSAQVGGFLPEKRNKKPH